MILYSIIQMMGENNMRLRNIYILCKENLEQLDHLTSVFETSSFKKVSGWLSIYQMCKNDLIQIDYLKSATVDLINSVPDLFLSQDSFKVENAVWDKINRARNELYDCMIDAINLYESLQLENTENREIGLDVKLPVCQEFSDLKKCIDELDFILYKCPFFQIKEETLKFKTFDVGSLWIFFTCVGIGTSSRILNNLAAFIDRCFIIKSHSIHLQEQKAQLEQLTFENKKKQDILEGIEAIYHKQVENVIKELETETGITLKNGEEQGIAITAFEKANALIEKGLQIHAAIDSPKENKALFDPIETKYLSIEKELKLLTQKDQESDTPNEET